MNMEQIKKKLNKSWNKSLMKIGFLVIAVIFLLEMFVFAISYLTGITDIQVMEYFLKKIVIPTGIQLFLIGVMYFVYKSKSNYLKNRRKEIFLCYNLFFVLAICVLVNRYYHVLWVAPCACLYLLSVYADKKQVRVFFVITIIFVLLCSLLAFLDGQYKPDYLAMTIVCVIGMLYIIYAVAKLLAGFHSEQLEYLQESYIRQEELIKELQLDPMTGLYNKNALLKKINSVREGKNKKKQVFYIAMLDLDHFKRVNDNYGHVSGDEVIRCLASLIKKYMNADIEGFRFGGEEFMVFFRNNELKKVLFIIEQICKEMQESQFEFDKDFRITLSVGIAKFENGMNHEMWIQKADEALYYAKNNGRNQIKIAE